MENYKGMLQSKTVWGGLLAVLAGVAGLLGYTVTATDLSSIGDAITSVVSMVGGLIAIYGRIKATKKIS